MSEPSSLSRTTDRFLHRALRATRALAACALLALLPAASSAADGDAIWLASGHEGGTYRAVYGANLARLLRGTEVLFRETAGSAENVGLLNAGRADIAFIQADVFAGAYTSGDTADLQVIGRLSDECLFVAHRVDGKVGSFADLKAPADGAPLNIAVGPPDSGAAASWRWISQLDPALAGNETDAQHGTLAVNQLAVGGFDAVVWITDPLNLEHKMLRAVLENDAVDLMPVVDEALLEPIGDGTLVYRKRKLELEGGWRPKKVETICTSALVVMRRDADPALVERVSDLVGLQRDLIAPRPKAR